MISFIKKICISCIIMIQLLSLLGSQSFVYAIGKTPSNQRDVSIDRISQQISNKETKKNIELSYGMTDGDITMDISQSTKKGYILLPRDTMLTQGGKYYQGDINDTAIEYDKHGHTMIRISRDHGIHLMDLNGNSAVATIMIENTAGVRQNIPLYSSDDGISREFHGRGIPTATPIGDYIVFQTDHFSYFLVGEATGIFTINNDDPVTTSASVTLNISGQSNMYQMRFGDTTVARDAAGWITYASSYHWTLTAGNGTKTVYAEIKDIYGNTGYVQDDILLSVPNSSPTGLRIHIDGSQSSATIFTDISGNGNNGKPFNGVTTGIINGETYMCFNGSNRYIEVNNNAGITAYPFTISAWVKTSSTTINGGIVSFANSATATTMYNLEHNLTFPRAKAQNTTARLATSTTAINTSQRSLITAVFTSNTSRTIYVNGGSPITNTSNSTFNTNANRIDIGRFADSSPSNYFNGCIDDVRIYNTDLTAGQIYDLYTQPATLSTTLSNESSPSLRGTIGNTLDRITITINGNTYTGTNAGNGTRSLPQGTISPSLPDGIYTVTMNIINPYDRSVSYTGSITIDTIPLTGYITYTPNTTTRQNVITTLTGTNKPFIIVNNNGLTTHTFTDNGAFIYTIQDMVGNTLDITAKVRWILTGFIDISMPNNTILPTINASPNNQVQTVGLNGMFSIADRKGTSNGYYTTLQASDIRSMNGNISNTNISLQASGLQLITGNTNPNIDLPTTWTTSYVNLASPTTFINRMGGTAGIKSQYGTNTSLRINIPAYTAPDSYQGVITLTIYEL